jgi:hypothetical protein
VHDQRFQRHGYVLVERLRVLLQHELHGVQRRLRERADRQEQLRRVRLGPRLWERPELPGRVLRVCRLRVPRLLSGQPVLQEQHDMRVPGVSRGLQLSASHT